MEKDVNLMLATYGKYFPETSLPQVREIFEHMDDTQAATLSCTQFKDPITSIILSVLLGQFGADRFYLEQIGIGIASYLLAVDWAYGRLSTCSLSWMRHGSIICKS